jgi:hypothetical protein
MKKFYVFIFVLIMASFMTSCHEAEEWWLEPTDSVPPGKVTVVGTISIAGGAKIIIEHPKDPDLLGVKVLYTMNTKHQDLTAYASAFTDTIVLEGFGDTDVHEVILIAMDKSLNESESVTTTIQPLPNIIESIKESINVYDGFGGLYVTWENPTNEDIALALSVYDETAGIYDLAVPLVFNSNAKFAQTIKGLEMEVSKQYRLEIIDTWQNYSSPLDVIGTPLKEEDILSKNEFDEYVWFRYQDNDDEDSNGPDVASENWKYRGEVGNYTGFRESIDNSWDNTMGWDFGCDPGNFYPGTSASRSGSRCHPFSYMMDLGRNVSISTYIFHQRKRTPMGSADFPVEFEIWGTLEPPREPSTIGDGSMLANLQYWTPWDMIPGNTNTGLPDLVINGQDTWKTEGGWVRLDSCSYRLPSGIRKGTGWPNSELSAEDVEFIEAGIVYEIPVTVPVRYLRFVIFETSKDAGKATILEQQFKGAYVDD